MLLLIASDSDVSQITQTSQMAAKASVDVLAGVEEHSDAILRVCAYHRRDFDLVVVRSRPHDMQPVQASLQAPFETSPTAELGILDSLPPELMSMVLRRLDLLSFFRFRQVNRRARIVSTNLWEYHLVSQYGLEGLRGLLRADLAYCFTIDHLYWSLLTDKCSACGAFGGHLFFFTAERCCLGCLQSSAHYRVFSVSAFTKLTRVSRIRLSRVPGLHLRTVPGIYNMMKTPARRPKDLVFEEKATQTLLATGAIGEDAIQKLRSKAEQPGQRFMAATAYPYYGLEDATLDYGVSCKGCQARLEALRDGFKDRDRIFSRQGFLSHFPYCEEGQQLWAQSQGGTRPVDEPEVTRRGGFFNRLGDDLLPA